MRMFNADGSEARCAATASAAWPSTPTTAARAQPKVASRRRGRQDVRLQRRRRPRHAARVDMGEPLLIRKAIPVPARRDEHAVDAALHVGRRRIPTCVSMGNPHAVIYVADVAGRAAGAGGRRSTPRSFPAAGERPLRPGHPAGRGDMRTWERGSGITLACGTGASAVCVAGVLTGRTGRQILAHLPGGDLELDCRRQPRLHDRPGGGSLYRRMAGMKCRLPNADCRLRETEGTALS